MKFFKCEVCGNFVEMVNESGAPMVCCGRDMTELVPGTTDGAHEKHVPVYTIKCNKVTVTIGASEHPMLATHYIEWIALETDKGAYRICIKPDEAPKAIFTIADDEKVLGVYAYCNIHGLWKNE